MDVFWGEERGLSDIVNIDDIRRLARRRLPRVVFDFVDGGAEDERTLERNRRAFDDLVLRPRVLQGVATRDQSVEVLGQRIATPVILSPAGLARSAHRDGEAAVARAASRHSTAFGLTSHSSVAMEDVARSLAPGTLWFQLYLWKIRERNLELLDRARRCGCRVLVVTVDAPVSGRRERDIRNRFSIPLRPTAGMVADVLRHPRWLRGYLGGGPITFANYTEMGGSRKSEALFELVNRDLNHPGATFEDLAWVRSQWDGPMVLKGVMTAEDAIEAVDLGVDAVCVSNHGGRQLDGVAAAIEVLPEVVAAVGDRAEVLIDGGFRRGTEVVKALALGARAVLVGRPYYWGLAAGGEAGVSKVLDLFKQEIDVTLALIGRAAAADVDASCVGRRAGTGLVPVDLDVHGRSTP